MRDVQHAVMARKNYETNDNIENANNDKTNTVKMRKNYNSKWLVIGRSSGVVPHRSRCSQAQKY